MEQSKPTLSKTQQAYEYIRSCIMNGTFGPGQRLVIDQIAKELELSTIPVREAIRQLEADGLIQYKPYSGAIVSVINETEYLETLSVLAVLEGYATALSSKRMTGEHILLLKDLNKQMREALENFEFEYFGELNRKFHAEIFGRCGNSFLEEEIRQTQQRMDSVRRSVFTIVPQRARKSLMEHEEIVNMLEEQAPSNKIEEFVREHKLNTARAFQNRKDSVSNPSD